MQMQARPGQLQRRAGRVPEPGVIVDILIEGGADKGVDRHAVRHFLDIPTQHLSHRQVSIEYG